MDYKNIPHSHFWETFFWIPTYFVRHFNIQSFIAIDCWIINFIEVNGAYTWLGFERAVELHVLAAWTLIALWVFAIFWHFTTGEWKQYIPTTEKLQAMIRYYLTGIFTDVPHPFRQTTVQKHNPLQRLAYLFVKLMINPLVWVTGLLYLYYNDWSTSWLGFMSLGFVAIMHTVAAYLMLIFVIVHIYFATTGHTPMSHIKAMITGWEEV